MKKKIIFHIGAGKSASSTIQTFLSENPILYQNDKPKKIKYFVINNEKILYGEQIKKLASESVYNYISSPRLSVIKNKFFQSLKHIFEIIKDDEIPILSNEAWSYEIIEYLDDLQKIFNDLDFEIEIFMVIRAPIPWINSAWWQWGIWTDHNLEYWTDHTVKTNKVNWLLQIDTWKKLKQVTKFCLVDLNSNVLDDFKKFLNVSNSWNKVSNLGTSAALLKFLLKNKEYYNRSVHNPSIEFKINNLLGKDLNGKTPFVINKDLQEFIMSNTIQQNKALINHFDNDNNKNNFLKNEQYYLIDAFKNFELRDLNNLATEIEINEFVKILMDNILRKN